MVLVSVLVWGCATSGWHYAAEPRKLAQAVFAPQSGKGAIVIVISGYSGPDFYRPFTKKLAEAGYYAVLLDGKDLFIEGGVRGPNEHGKANFRRAIESAQHTPSSISGKVAVVGFSLGGGAALAYATAMPEAVSAVIAYYPTTSFVAEPRAFAERFRAPILVLAGERDRYNNCCLIETIRAIEAAASERQAAFALVVYPEAYHGFNLTVSPRYRSDYDLDAWQRTVEMLRQYQPLP